MRLDESERIRQLCDEQRRLLEQRKRDLVEGRLMPARQALKQMRVTVADARKQFDNTDSMRCAKGHTSA